MESAIPPADRRPVGDLPSPGGPHHPEPLGCTLGRAAEDKMDNRTDPIEIIARVSEQDGKQRAFEVWLYKADKEGWSVAVESTSVEAPGDECGVVDIEGLRYRIRHARRVRQHVAIVPAGQHLIAAAVKLSLASRTASPGHRSSCTRLGLSQSSTMTRDHARRRGTDTAAPAAWDPPTCTASSSRRSRRPAAGHPGTGRRAGRLAPAHGLGARRPPAAVSDPGHGHPGPRPGR